MPQIAPFRAVRYARAETGELARRLAPPYDIISPLQREVLAARDPHNIVHLELPQVFPSDDAENTAYRRAGLAYRQWLAAGELLCEPLPALYLLHQQFSWADRRYLRRGLLCRLRLQPFSAGVVLPHERTLSAPKADRLQLLRQVRANLSPIFALYPDEGQRVARLLATATDRPPDFAAPSDDGTANALWRVTDSTLVAAVAAALSPKPAFIADGHHRYETGLAYAAEVDAGLAEPRPAGAHHGILAYLCSLSDPGLLILPTHRLLQGLANFDAVELVQRARRYFEITALGESLATPAGLAAAQRRLGASGESTPSVLLHAGGGTWLLALRPEVDLGAMPELPALPALRRLDVAVVHGLLLQRLLGLSPDSQERQENLRYRKDAAEAVGAVAAGAAQAVLLLNATRIDQVCAVAQAGAVLPQKSTYFFPKLPSGLVIHSLDGDR